MNNATLLAFSCEHLSQSSEQSAGSKGMSNLEIAREDHSILCALRIHGSCCQADEEGCYKSNNSNMISVSGSGFIVKGMEHIVDSKLYIEKYNIAYLSTNWQA